MTPLFPSASPMFPKRGRVAIIGPNGSGKTTLLKIIAGITTSPYLPSILIFDFKIAGL